MYYTPDNYTELKVGMVITDVHFGITWKVIEVTEDVVVIQNQPPKGAKIYLKKDSSKMIFHKE